MVLPITLLEEIDRFKRGLETINFNARKFSRELDTLIGKDLIEGVNHDAIDRIFRNGFMPISETGLTCLIDKMKGQEIYAHITMEKGERSLLAEIASDLL